MKDFATSNGYVTNNADTAKNRLFEQGTSIATRIESFPGQAFSDQLKLLLKKKTRYHHPLEFNSDFHCHRNHVN